jgi:cytochrome c-type biogenesis protein CcmH/NrfG
LRTALERLPSSAQAAHALAELLDAGHRAAEAQQLLVATLERDPYDFEALVLLSRVLLDVGHVGDAVAAAARVVRVRPDHVAADYYLGVALARERRYREAVDHWHQCIALAPSGVLAPKARAHARTAQDLVHIFASEAA